MSEIINVQCYSCKTVYELEYELRGQLVECVVCDTIFIVPKLSEKHKSKILKTSPYVEDGEQKALGKEQRGSNIETVSDLDAAVDTTSKLPRNGHTDKLSKNSRGMVPKVNDKFGVSSMKHLPTHHSLTNVNQELVENSEENPEECVEKVPKKAKKWWHWGNKKE